MAQVSVTCPGSWDLFQEVTQSLLWGEVGCPGCTDLDSPCHALFLRTAQV